MICCPNCGDLCPDGQTRCGECGRPLPVSTVEPLPAPRVHGCTCHNNGICTACVIDSYDRIPA